MPVVEGDFAVVAPARCARRAALLLSAVDPIRELVIGDHMIELRRRLVVPGAPGAAAVHGGGRSLIDAQQDDVGILRVDPDAVIVVPAGRALPRDEVLAAVGGLVG